MNQIDEYKKKINYDVWADVTGIPFQQETEVASLPRKIFKTVSRNIMRLTPRNVRSLVRINEYLLSRP